MNWNDRVSCGTIGQFCALAERWETAWKPCRTSLPPGGSGEHAAVTLTRVAGYRRSLRENNDAQLSAQSRTLRIRLKHSLDFSNVGTTSPPGAVAILPLSDFHEFSRAIGPKGLNRVHPTCTERQSLTKECGWKGGDRRRLGSMGTICNEKKEEGRKKERKNERTGLTLTGLLMEALSPQTVALR
jgi:hypothetical protein